MKTSLMNGLNTSKLEFNYMVTFRPKYSPKFELMETTISNITKNVNYEHLVYYWERDKLIKKYHSHILIQIDFDNLISEMYSNIKGKSRIISGKRDTIVRVETKNGLKDKKVNVDFTEFHGGCGKIYIEPIIQKTNSCHYVTKFSDRGIISGFLTP